MFAVPEGDDSVRVCAILTCTTLSPMLLELKVIMVANTAMEGVGKSHSPDLYELFVMHCLDYTSTGSNLLDEMNCYDIEIITHIEYDGTKEFIIYLTSNQTERIEAVTAQVVIYRMSCNYPIFLLLTLFCLCSNYPVPNSVWKSRKHH